MTCFDCCWFFAQCVSHLSMDFFFFHFYNLIKIVSHTMRIAYGSSVITLFVMNNNTSQLWCMNVRSSVYWSRIPAANYICRCTKSVKSVRYPTGRAGVGHLSVCSYLSTDQILLHHRKFANYYLLYIIHAYLTRRSQVIRIINNHT